jgi:membrane protein YqaA with SNARE-associated domain
MHAFSRWIIGLFASPAGVVVLAALDSTVFFTLPLGIDTAVILLAARKGTSAWIAPLLATAGSIGGAYLTFWMGETLGERGLERYVRRRTLNRVRKRVRNSGAVALAILDLIPPPFPFTAFVLAAGTLGVNRTRFFVTLVVCRLVRFGGEALLAVIYGRQILAWLDSDLFHDIVSAMIILSVVACAISLAKLLHHSTSRRGSAA